MSNLNITQLAYEPDQSPIKILFQDDDLVIVDKATNLLTTPGRGPEKQDCLYHRLLALMPNARVIHRLDMATSGVVVFALHHQSQVGMGRLFEERKISKAYTAIVSGQLEKTEGEIDFPLICDWENRPLQKVCYETGKAAKTHFKVVNYQQDADLSRVELTPLTGRSHQLRVHMQSIGHPIKGDVFYHHNYQNDFTTRLYLHAHRMEFVHPINRRKIVINSPPPF